MRNLAIFGAAPFPQADHPCLRPVVIDDVPLRCGIVRTAEPSFDATAPEHAGKVLVRTRAFSCNYRDRGFASSMRHHAPHRFFVVGSELVGEVMEVGAGVRGLAPGDRVLANHHYDGRRTLAGNREGVLSNQSSKEFHVFPGSRLVLVPDSMCDDTAGGFGLNAQTAYSMVRRLDVKPREKVLVTSARSNLSLFVIGALRHIGARIFATTTSLHHEARLRPLGVEEVILLERGRSFREARVVDEVAQDLGGFDCVVDPMFDAHVEKSLAVMAPYGRYATCGLIGQTPNSLRHSGLSGAIDGIGLLTRAVTQNLTLIGNCIGLTTDLEAALSDYAAKRFDIVVDSSFSRDQAAGFLNRTFNDPDRFGKVVFRYE